RSCAGCCGTSPKTGLSATQRPLPIPRSSPSSPGAARKRARKKRRRRKIRKVNLHRAVEAPARRGKAQPSKQETKTSRALKRRGLSPRRAANALAAAIVSAAVLYAAFFGAGPLPALGPAFNPVTGAWTMAADAQVSSGTLHLAGLQQPARVTLEPDGTAHIVAQTDHDLFLATGYVHAKFRLFEMDLMRRQGEGRLSEIVGKAALDVDRLDRKSVGTG